MEYDVNGTGRQKEISIGHVWFTTSLTAYPTTLQQLLNVAKKEFPRAGPKRVEIILTEEALLLRRG